ncbi:MAG: hypothetical protein HRU38_16470 [Saccharospirillaceae bacterium]|nr:hypothetical protein [Saccharospirillaceae bacterium]
MPESISTFETSDYIALVSAFIALLVFGLTVWQGMQTRKHNQLSVKPFLDFSWVNNHEKGLKCEIVNSGIGPAFLNQINFFVDDKKFHIKGRNDYKSLFEALDLNEILGQVSVQHIEPNSALSIGQTNDLLVFCDSSVLKSDYELIASKLRRFSVQVEYKCIYGVSYQSSKSGLL